MPVADKLGRCLHDVPSAASFTKELLDALELERILQVIAKHLGEVEIKGREDESLTPKRRFLPFGFGGSN